MAVAPRTGAACLVAVGPPAVELPPFFTIRELSARWRCSRGSVYNWLRGSKVVDFAPARRSTKKHPHGRKLVPREVVLALEEKQTRTLR